MTHLLPAVEGIVRASTWPALALGLAVSGLLPQTGLAQQKATSAGGIYTCVDERGRRLTSDRPIPECSTREQRELNRDGSVRAVIPPILTAEERAERDARERRAAEQRAAHADAVRRDRNLMARFRSEDAHGSAREAALEQVRLAHKATERRLAELAVERKPLASEAEFYVGRPMPTKLRNALDANDAAVDAQRAAAANQAAEIDRINRLFDAELDRLRKLWAGAAPGTLGPLSAPNAAASGAANAAASTARTGSSTVSR